MNDSLGTWRTARNVDVNRHVIIHSDGGVGIIEGPLASRAGSDGNHVFGFSHLVVQVFYSEGHLTGDYSNDHNAVALPYAGEGQNTEAFHVVTRTRDLHELRATASRYEVQRPDRIFPRPTEDVVGNIVDDT